MSHEAITKLESTESARLPRTGAHYPLQPSAPLDRLAGLCRGIPDVVGGVTLTCDVGTIAKGSQADVVVNVDAPASLGTYGVGASVASAEVDPNTNNNFVLINVQV